MIWFHGEFNWNFTKTFLQHIFVSWVRSLCHQQMFPNKPHKVLPEQSETGPAVMQEQTLSTTTSLPVLVEHSHRIRKLAYSMFLASNWCPGTTNLLPVLILKCKQRAQTLNDKQFLGWRTHTYTDPQRTSRVPSSEIFPFAPQAKTTLCLSVFSPSPYFKVH